MAVRKGDAAPMALGIPSGAGFGWTNHLAERRVET